MTTEWESHPGEEQLHITAATPEQVIVEAVAAFAELVTREAGGAPAVRRVAVSADDRAGLLVELLGELIYLSETDGFVADAAEVEMDETSLCATLAGRLTSVDPLVKAATYHGLTFEQRGGTWDARIVLDV